MNTMQSLIVVNGQRAEHAAHHHHGTVEQSIHRAIDAGYRFGGCTVHRVTAELDHGEYLDQAVVPILPGDTAQTLAARVLTQEHLIYPRVVERLIS